MGARTALRTGRGWHNLDPMYYENAAPAGPHPKLDSLGIAYVVLGVLDIPWGLLLSCFGALGLVSGETTRGALGPELSEAYATGHTVGGALGVVLSFAGVVVGALSIYAGLRMRKGEAYALGLAAVIANMVPCYNSVCCGLFGIPIGIWALVVLLDGEVKASFR